MTREREMRPGKATLVDATDHAVPTPGKRSLVSADTAPGARSSSLFDGASWETIDDVKPDGVSADASAGPLDTMKLTSLRFALQSARRHCDAELDKPAANAADYVRISQGALKAVEDLEHAHRIAKSGDIGRELQDEVELATRSVGRMVAFVKDANSGSSVMSKAMFVPVGSDWRGRVELYVGEIRKAAGLSQHGWVGDMVDKRAVAADEAPPDKEKANQEIKTWNHEGGQHILALRHWLTENWMAFLGSTSENPRLSWDANMFEQTASNFVGNVLGAAGEQALKKSVEKSAAFIGAAIGSSAGPPGVLVGFALGLLIETVSSVIYDFFRSGQGRAEQDKARAEAVKKAVTLSREKHAQFSGATARAMRQHSSDIGGAQDALNGAASQAKVNAIEEHARTEAEAAKGTRDSTDLTLYKQMLSEWVLEHAGDEEDAAKGTSEWQWTKVNEELFNSAHANNQPKMFAYQSRATWMDAGFDSAQVHLAFERMMKEPAPNRSVVTFTGVKPGELHRYMKKHSSSEHADEILWLGKQQERSDRVVTCTLDLATSDGTTYVHGWDYVIDVRRRENDGSEYGPQARFRASPD